MAYVRSGGAELYYEVLGAGRPFVFSHGLGGDLERVREFVADLPGVQVILYDNRAHGRTRAALSDGDLSFARMADDVAALLDHLAIPRAFVGGVSMGAGIALSFALRNPQRAQGLVLSRPAWLDAPFPPNLAFAGILAELIAKLGIEEAISAFERTEYYKSLLATSPGAAESLLGILTGADADRLLAAYHAIPASTPIVSMTQLAAIRIPALVIGNHNDPIHPFSIAEAWARALPDCGFRTIPSRFDDNAGHLHQFRQVVTEFLSEIP